jgi:PTH1 family peptidyl-tRNA hydrolase
MEKSFLIVGLGNPGKEYANTRHNIGFMILERLAPILDLNGKRLKNSLHTWQKVIRMRKKSYSPSLKVT